ncbi:hemerythrin family protein [Terasakiella sp. SH-1]|uniref:bacteriohemerythrin n=1 Tax=Terasakiella sp. SH-1 TaxID=2560057 RepID=UPI0014300D48|nr:hemerythrin family protein [Terasakiella sp. SH-1]
METITWQNARHRTGHDKIDRKNKRIVSLYNQLHDLNENDYSEELVTEILWELVEYADHLIAEEALLEERGASNLEIQKAKHSAFLQKVCSICEAFEERQPDILYQIKTLLSDWWNNHALIDEIKNRPRTTH